MKIIMLKTRYGSEDGFAVRLFLKGMEYEIASSLAIEFIRSGAAALAQTQERIQNESPNTSLKSFANSHNCTI